MAKTNPNNAIGTNGAYNGRTSVEAFNDHLSYYSGAGIVSGWACTPSGGLTVALGGAGDSRDVAIASNPDGARVLVNNRTSEPIEMTVAGAPSTNSRIDVIVGYVDNPPQGEASTVDNPSACGILAISGTASSSPVAPTETEIRTAITSDGGSGSNAYYVVLATITVPAGITTLTASNITAGDAPQVNANKIGFDSIRDEANSLPVLYKEIPVGYGITGKFYRVGNLVMISHTVTTTGLANLARGERTLDESIPVGFRPVDQGVWSNGFGGSITFADGAGCDFSWGINSDGRLRLSNNTNITYTGNIRLQLYGIWVTNDPWTE